MTDFYGRNRDNDRRWYGTTWPAQAPITIDQVVVMIRGIGQRELRDHALHDDPSDGSPSLVNHILPSGPGLVSHNGVSPAGPPCSRRASADESVPASTGFRLRARHEDGRRWCRAPGRLRRRCAARRERPRRGNSAHAERHSSKACYVRFGFPRGNRGGNRLPPPGASISFSSSGPTGRYKVTVSGNTRWGCGRGRRRGLGR
jgi:hypothetical protein